MSMRLNLRPVWLSAMLVLAASSARAEPYTAVVRLDADVRCGPSLNPLFYATNRLHAGQTVAVLKERDDGWLEVAPPPGSFSWIEKRFLDPDVHIEPNAVVGKIGELKAQVLVGSEVVADQPTKAGAYLATGQQVTPMGKEITDKSGVVWVRIQPPPAEVRYVRAEAVKAAGAEPAPKAAIPAARPAEDDAAAQYWRAMELENADPQQAADLMAKTAERDPDAKRRQTALDYAAFLRKQSPGWKAATKTGATGQLTSNLSRESRVYPLPADPPAPPSVRLAPPASGQPPSTAPAAADGDPPGWYRSGVGQLRKFGGRDEQSRQLYVLDDASGRTLYYLTPASGIDLQPYLGRRLECFGPAEFNGKLRANYMIAMRLQPTADGK
jgi:hypothetical protein